MHQSIYAGGVSGLRERKKHQCRLAVQRAALELVVANDGLDGVTVEAIAERAGISTRTFFNYFPAKEAALLNAYIGRQDDLAERIRSWPGNEPVSRIIADVLLDSIPAGDPEVSRLLREVLGKQPDVLGLSAGNLLATNRVMAEAAAERINAHDLPTRRRLIQITSALSAVIRATIAFHNAHELPPEDLEHELGLAVDGVLAGMPDVHPSPVLENRPTTVQTPTAALR